MIYKRDCCSMEITISELKRKVFFFLVQVAPSKCTNATNALAFKLVLYLGLIVHCMHTTRCNAMWSYNMHQCMRSSILLQWHCTCLHFGNEINICECEVYFSIRKRKSKLENLKYIFRFCGNSSNLYTKPGLWNVYDRPRFGKGAILSNQIESVDES